MSSAFDSMDKVLATKGFFKAALCDVYMCFMLNEILQTTEHQIHKSC